MTLRLCTGVTSLTGARAVAISIPNRFADARRRFDGDVADA
jgi:hypothetical protein